MKSNEIDSIMVESNSKISETIENLKIRCAIRHKLVDILNPLIKLNILISLYFLFFVFLPKYVISLWIQLNLAAYSKQAEQSLVDLFSLNSSTNKSNQARIVVFQSLKCCYIKYDNLFEYPFINYHKK